MKIRKLLLKNVGVFDSELIEFPPCPVGEKAEIHILTGQNGTGKSTVLLGLANAFKHNSDPHAREQMERKFLEQWTGLVNTAQPKTEKEIEFIGPLQGILDLFEERSRISHIPRIGKIESIFDKRFRFFKNSFNREGEYESYSSIRFDNNMGSITFGCHCGTTHTFHEDKMFEVYGELLNEKERLPNVVFNSMAFAYSGYRYIKDEKIELGSEVEENPLFHSLDFVKDETSRFTINQWLGRSLSKRALAKEERNKSAKTFNKNIENLETVISKVTGKSIRFKLKMDLHLVLMEGEGKDVRELDFDVLPDGLKSLISWIGDLLMRLDSVKWENDLPIFEREIILFLDEIEVHLHPAWQRKVLPVIQNLFKNAQIFVSTHSPFVVNSVDNAWVYKLDVENGHGSVSKPVKSEDGISYQTVLSEVFDVTEEFGGKTQEDLEKFYEIVRNGREFDENNLKRLAKSLAKQSEELNAIVQIELRQFNRRTHGNVSL